MQLKWHVSCINIITQVRCSLHDFTFDWLLSLVLIMAMALWNLSSLRILDNSLVVWVWTLSTNYGCTVHVVWLGYTSRDRCRIYSTILMTLSVTFLWLSSYDHSLRQKLSYSLMTEQHCTYMTIRHSMARHKDLKSMTYTSRFAFCRHQQVYWRH